MAVGASADVLRYCVEKGSVTVDGVSLTVASLAGEAFKVALVRYARGDDVADLEPGRQREPRGRRLPRSTWRGSWCVEGYDPRMATDLTAPETESRFATVEEAIEDVRRGRSS